MKRRLLGWIGAKWGNRDPQYPQTWALVTRLPWHWMRQGAAELCRLWGGHDWSATEWGYAGGAVCDRWCRWCNAFSTQPLAENPLTDTQRELKRILDAQDFPLPGGGSQWLT